MATDVLFILTTYSENQQNLGLWVSYLFKSFLKFFQNVFEI